MVYINAISSGDIPHHSQIIYIAAMGRKTVLRKYVVMRDVNNHRLDYDANVWMA